MKKKKTGISKTDIWDSRVSGKGEEIKGKARPGKEKLHRPAGRHIMLFLVLCACTLMMRFVTGPCLVSGTSMEASLHDRDFLLSDRTGYLFGKPERFDVIEYYPGEDKSIQYIKRIIGLPGETVQIDGDGKIYINGEVLEESYGKEPARDAGCASGEGVTLGDDEVFCLGDNRNYSMDSRFLGPVKISRIYGHPYFRLFPFTRIGKI